MKYIMPIVIVYLAITKTFYTLYYDFMVIINFYLNQGNCKTPERHL